MSFPQLIREAGQKKIDILIVPADQPADELDPTQTEMYLMRGIENGVSVILLTLDGLSAGMDYQGNLLSRLDFDITRTDRTMLMDVPTKGETTLYALSGDWFAYGNVLAAAILLVWAVTRKGKAT